MKVMQVSLFNFWHKAVPVKEFDASPATASKQFNASAKSIKFKKELYGDRENFEYPNMTLYEISRAVATDSYIAESLNKYKEKIFKAGYYFKGESEPIDYLNKRLSLISFMNETIFEVLLQEIADDFITYQNAYLLKLRVDEIPFIKAKPFTSEKVIGGYMRLDPCEVVIVKDKYNNIVRYELEQGGGAENLKVNKQDIVHFYMNRKGQDKQGTPRLEPVLEDVKALRDIEGDVLTLIHRFCFPMYHVKVGLPQTGYSGNQTDIDAIKYEIENMSEDGMLITNEKVEVKTIGAEGNALDMKDYLDYFEKRIFSGLNTSASQMGRDVDSTPDSLEAQIHDSVKHIQRHIALFLEQYIFNELLLEGGFNPILEEEHRVHMIFNEISLDTRVKLENHEALKYQSNVQTLTETRAAIGKSVEVDMADLYADNVTNYVSGVQVEQQTDGAVEVAKVNAALSTDSNKKVPSKDNKTQKKSNAVTTNNRPENQHGVYSVNIKEALAKSQSCEEKLKEITDQCYKIYNRVGNEDFEKAKNYQNKLISSATQAVLLGAEACESYTRRSLISDLEPLQKLYAQKVRQAFEKLFKELTADNLEAKAYRVKFIVHYWHKKYFWHCYCLTQKQAQIKTLYLAFSRPEEAENRTSKINLDLITLNDLEHIDLLPPFHPYCHCKLELTKPHRKEKERV